MKQETYFTELQRLKNSLDALIGRCCSHFHTTQEYRDIERNLIRLVTLIQEAEFTKQSDGSRTEPLD